ncbi:integrase, catalytic region, zinc finger, CCHC-type containing protein [Tanacetum coccineum]
MSTQQDIYAAGFKNCPPMLNKENYVPWSSRLLRYAKSRPNGQLIYNSIMNGLYVRRMIPEPGDPFRTVPVPKTFHEQTDDELTEAEIKQTEADDHATDDERNKHFPEKIASNLKFLNNLQPEWSRLVTIVHQIKDLHTADYTQLYDFLKYNQKEVDELRVERLAKTQDPLALMANSNNSFKYPVFHPDQPSSSMNLGQDNQMQIVGGNRGNQFRQYAGQNAGNQNGNGNVVIARAEGNANGNNGNQIRCYNCRGLGHLARNCTVRPRRRDAAYLQTQLLIAQKEEAGIQLQAEEFDLMAAAADLDEIEEVNANCILMANLQQASTSGTQTDKAPVYDSDGSAEVQLHDKCYNDEIFNMFTQEEQYTELLEPIPEPHQVPQNDSNAVSEVSSVEQGGGTVEQHPANVEETRVLYDSLYNNLATEVEKVNSVNRKLRETNANLTNELARNKNQER